MPSTNYLMLRSARSARLEARTMLMPVIDRCVCTLRQRRDAGLRLVYALALLVTIASASIARAQQSVADFYRGKQVQLRIGSAPGTGYDLAGRLVAPYLAKYLPGNPSVIVQAGAYSHTAPTGRLFHPDPPKEQSPFTPAHRPKCTPRTGRSSRSSAGRCDRWRGSGPANASRRRLEFSAPRSWPSGR